MLIFREKNNEFNVKKMSTGLYYNIRMSIYFYK